MQGTCPAEESEMRLQPFSLDKRPSPKLLPTLLEILFVPKTFNPFRKRPYFPRPLPSGERGRVRGTNLKNLVFSN